MTNESFAVFSFSVILTDKWNAKKNGKRIDYFLTFAKNKSVLYAFAQRSFNMV